MCSMNRDPEGLLNCQCMIAWHQHYLRPGSRTCQPQLSMKAVGVTKSRYGVGKGYGKRCFRGLIGVIPQLIDAFKIRLHEFDPYPNAIGLITLQYRKR